ncbi:hypothetical protein ITG08_05905 [Vibrio cyclitrophicus]|uniref:hypothetical protein n=1 Tax=Vibrio cyclitrophicus TaxID=47951 RepID=UPI002067C463|nr:hypothetical protein [Vibrio cyclitrophicus]UPR26719.1 hypothetical protein ITG08_05905 [Vibrio cyclitrophicus]
MRFAVSNYYKYELVSATSEIEAVTKFMGRYDLVRLNDEQLKHDSTVVLAMCVAYTNETEKLLELLSIDVDRVLFMDVYNGTSFYSID